MSMRISRYLCTRLSLIVGQNWGWRRCQMSIQILICRGGGGAESQMMSCRMRSVNQNLSHPNAQSCRGSCLLTGTKGGGPADQTAQETFIGC